MTEQHTASTETARPVSVTPQVEQPKRMRKPKKIAAKTAEAGKPSKPMTDEQKRLARNAALRAWRQAHVEEQRLYYAAWREKKAKAAKKAVKAAKKGAKA